MITRMAKLGLLAASFAFAAALAGGAAAYQCKTQSESVALPGATQGTALATAHATWTSKVRQTLGLEWSVWSIAAARQQSCVQAAAGHFMCHVAAKPCKYVVP